MNLTLSSEEITALKEALVSATKRSEEACQQSQLLKSELVLVRTERDLLQEQLNKFKRDLFAAKSEASAAHQNDLLFNEAEHLGAAAQPGVEETADQADAIDVPAHKRKKRGRKPLDPALPRHVVRHELPQAECMCPHDGATLQEIGVEPSTSTRKFRNIISTQFFVGVLPGKAPFNSSFFFVAHLLPSSDLRLQ